MDDFRTQIKSRADKLGLTAFAISKQSDGKLNPRAVQRFFSGTNITIAKLEIICSILGLNLAEKKRVKK